MNKRKEIKKSKKNPLYFITNYLKMKYPYEMEFFKRKKLLDHLDKEK